LGGLVARAVADRHVVLSRFVDMADPAGVGVAITQRWVMRGIERAALGIKAASRASVAGVVF